MKARPQVKSSSDSALQLVQSPDWKANGQDQVMSVSPDMTTTPVGIHDDRKLQSMSRDSITTTAPADVPMEVSSGPSPDRSLAGIVQQASKQQADSERAAMQLQERLRLSARMLKALQSQIAGAEDVIEHMHDRSKGVAEAAAKLNGIDDLLDAKLDSFENRMQAIADACAERMQSIVEQQISKLDQHGRVISELIDTRAAECERSLDDLRSMIPRADIACERLESSEVSLAALRGQCNEAENVVHEAVAALEHAVEQSSETRQMLEEGLEHTQQQISALAEKGNDVERSLRMQMDRADHAEENLMLAIEQVEIYLRSAAADIESTPIDAQADDGSYQEAKPVSPVLKKLMQDLRDGLGADIDRLSSQMQGVLNQSPLNPQGTEGDSKEQAGSI